MKSDKWKQTDGKAFIKENHNLNSNRNKSNRPNQGIIRKYAMKFMEMAGNWINSITIVGFDNYNFMMILGVMKCMTVMNTSYIILLGA